MRRRLQRACAPATARRSDPFGSEPLRDKIIAAERFRSSSLLTEPFFSRARLKNFLDFFVLMWRAIGFMQTSLCFHAEVYHTLIFLLDANIILADVILVLGVHHASWSSDTATFSIVVRLHILLHKNKLEVSVGRLGRNKKILYAKKISISSLVAYVSPRREIR